MRRRSAVDSCLWAAAIAAASVAPAAAGPAIQEQVQGTEIQGPEIQGPEIQDFLLLKDGRLVANRKIERASGGLELLYENGRVLVPDGLVQEYFIDGEVLAPATDEEKEQAAKGNVRFEGRWMSKRSRDQLIEKRVGERKAYFAEIAKRSQWGGRAKVETKHFRFEHTLPDHVFERYSGAMEAYFEVFVKEWKIKLPKDYEPLLVSFYSDFTQMKRTGGAGSYALGYFRFVRPWELNFFYQRLDPLFTEEVMYHETGHFLHKLIDPRFDMPHFPGEALAEYYGASRYDPETRKIETGLVLEGRLCEVKDDLAKGERMGLQKLVSTDQMYEHYTWGWSLAHFLMSKPDTAKKFQKFVMALPFDKDIKRTYYQNVGDQLCKVDSGEVWRAFERYMGLKDEGAIRTLERQWHHHVEEVLDVVSHRGFESAATKAADGFPSRPLKAKRLFQTAVDMGTRNPATFHRYGQLLDDEHETVPKAIEMFRQAVALDPLEGQYWGALGNALIKSGAKDEGERLKKLAIEIDPDALWITLDEHGIELVGDGR